VKSRTQTGTQEQTPGWSVPPLILIRLGKSQLLRVAPWNVAQGRPCYMPRSASSQAGDI